MVGFELIFALKSQCVWFAFIIVSLFCVILVVPLLEVQFCIFLDGSFGGGLKSCCALLMVDFVSLCNPGLVLILYLPFKNWHCIFCEPDMSTGINFLCFSLMVQALSFRGLLDLWLPIRLEYGCIIGWTGLLPFVPIVLPNYGHGRV